MLTLKELEVELNKRVQASYPAFSIPYNIPPRVYVMYDPRIYTLPGLPKRLDAEYYPPPTHRVYIYVPERTWELDNALAVVAHELGHVHEEVYLWGLFPQKRFPVGEYVIDVPHVPGELYAFLQGVRYAREWGILPEYIRVIDRVFILTPKEKLGEFARDLERLKNYIRRLF